jgi:hypothetical protein
VARTFVIPFRCTPLCISFLLTGRDSQDHPKSLKSPSPDHTKSDPDNHTNEVPPSPSSAAAFSAPPNEESERVLPEVKDIPQRDISRPSSLENHLNVCPSLIVFALSPVPDFTIQFQSRLGADKKDVHLNDHRHPSPTSQFPLPFVIPGFVPYRVEPSYPTSSYVHLLFPFSFPCSQNTSNRHSRHIYDTGWHPSPPRITARGDTVTHYPAPSVSSSPTPSIALRRTPPHDYPHELQDPVTASPIHSSSPPRAYSPRISSFHPLPGVGPPSPVWGFGTGDAASKLSDSVRRHQNPSHIARAFGIHSWTLRRRPSHGGVVHQEDFSSNMDSKATVVSSVLHGNVT